MSYIKATEEDIQNNKFSIDIRMVITHRILLTLMNTQQSVLTMINCLISTMKKDLTIG